MTKTPKTQPSGFAAEPRRPRQKRSRERVEKLLDAADELLATRDVADVGLYDIAAQAGIPPASVYHFLPTREAAFVALAERYLDRLNTLSRTPLPQEEIQTWQDFFAVSNRRAMEFYNANPVFMKLFFGGSVLADVRRRDVEYVERLSARTYRWMDQYFHMPYLPRATKEFSIVWAIFDGLFLASYVRHGQITAEYTEELTRVIVAYCRTFLPDFLPPRIEVISPAA